MFKPNYKITNKILNNLLEIAEIKYLISHISILPIQEAKLRRNALIRMTHSSTSIEGNILNRHEVEKVFAGKKVDAPLRDIFEVKNYAAAMRYITGLADTKKSIDRKIILEVHQLATNDTLEKEKCGKLRKDKVYVVKQQYGQAVEVMYKGPEAKDVPKLIDDLVKYIEQAEKAKICPVIIAGVIHAEIAAIHPFADGNGRTARALATLVLYKNGYDFRRLFALEDYYNKNRPNYYKAIHLGKTYKERQGADITDWLEYFVEGMKKELEEVKRTILPLSFDEKMRNKIGQIYLDKKQIKVIDFVITIGKITSDDVVDILNITKRTAQRYLTELVKINLLKRQGSGTQIFYALNL